MLSTRPLDVRVRGRARPSELVAVVLALAEREALPERDGRRADQAIGPGPAPGRGLSIVRHWLASAPSAGTRARIARVRSGLSLARWVLFTLGLGLGWSTAAGLLQVEVHEGRVNVVLCLALLVVAPGLLLVGGILGAIWAARPASASGDGGWRALAFGRGVRALLPAKVREDAEVLLGRGVALDRRFARVRAALLFSWSQTVGMGFSSGALLATLGFVAFTDLAFGWSTTLDVEAGRFHELVAGLATPWSTLWPAAAPTLDLVETTRHFRVTAGAPHVHFMDPLTYGAWWPFLCMSLVFYGLVPRSIVHFLGLQRLGVECADAIAETPGLERLIARLLAPPVETRASGTEGDVGEPGADRAERVEATEWLEAADGEGLVIAWAESLDAAEWAALTGEAGGTFRLLEAGGRCSLSEDAERVDEAGRTTGRVAVVVRAYEPPLLETLDFLLSLRASIGPVRPLAVLLHEGSPRDHEAWRRRLATLGDPRLVCAPLEAAS